MTMDVPFGFRFNPTEEELISYYLKNKIMGTPMLEWEYRVMVEGQLYGENNTPWELLTYENPNIPWQYKVDSMGKLDVSERVVYVFTQLSNVGKTAKSENIQKARVAGCGTWHGNTTALPIFENNGKGSRKIGYRRTFTFRSSVETVGQWTMYEYAIDAEAHGIPDGMDSVDYVLCRIKRNDSKCSKDGKLVPRKRNANAMLENSCDDQSLKKERSEASTSYSNAHQTEVFSSPAVMATEAVDNSNGMCYSRVNQGTNIAMDQQCSGTYCADEKCYSGVNQGMNIAMDQQQCCGTYCQDCQGATTSIQDANVASGDGSCSITVDGAAPGNDNGGCVPYPVDAPGSGYMSCNNPNLYNVEEDVCFWYGLIGHLQRL